MSKTWKIVLSILVVVLVLGVIFNYSKKEKVLDSSKEIKIGVILPLSGNLADVGNNNLEAIRLAVDEINSEGGILGKKVTIIAEDNKGCTTLESVNAMKKLITFDKVNFIYSICSGGILASHPIAENAGVLHLGCAGHSKIADLGDYMFRLIPPESEASYLSAKYIAQKLNKKNVAILHAEDDWSMSAKIEFADALQSFGVKPLLTEQIKSSAKDVRTELLKLKNANPEIIFFASYPQEAITAFKQSKELGMNIPFFGGTSWYDSSLAEFVNTSDDMLIMHSQYVTPEFKEKLNNNVLLCTPQAYDAIHLFKKAITAANTTDPSKVKDEMYKITYDGQSGHFEFDELGELVGSHYDIVSFKDGSFIVVDHISESQ